MNFVVFPTVSTNIFPQANSVGGGQLMSEFNLRSRESIATPQSIKYMIGPSYLHSEDDFKVRIYSDELGTAISSSVIEILPGRGLINGHYVESLTNIQIDLNEANMRAKTEGEPKLSGKLCVGIKAMYSTEATMAGAIMVENDQNMYEGIQIVILPESQFKLPIDVPEDQASITAHIKLATFNYINGTITNIIDNYPNKCQVMSSDRLGDVDRLLSDKYITRSGLNPKKLYTFAGKGSDPSTGQDTWCDSTDSLIVWDTNPQLTNTPQVIKESQFMIDSDGVVNLALPHKQVDGMTSTDGKSQYYQTKYTKLPVANFNTNSSGTVNSDYTKHVKSVLNKINEFYNYPGGKQRGYIDIFNTDDTFPDINPAWDVGDYIIIGQDYTVDYEYSDNVSGVPTMVVVIPGTVTNIVYSGYMVENSMTPPTELTGIEISSDTETVNDYDSWTKSSITEASGWTSEKINQELWKVDDSNWLGIPKVDFFRYIVYDYNDKDNTNKYKVYYFVVDKSTKYKYSNHIPLLGQVPLAEESVIGGFYNVPNTALDNGYVYRNDEGYLQLLDYELLRTGVLAYQLGQDFTSDAGLSAEELQQILNEYINDRVAFPNSIQAETDTPNVINLTLNLQESDTDQEINIYDIDSRFNTSIYIHINGTAGSNTTIKVSNCEKVRIDPNIPSTDNGSPVLEIRNCRLYYDATILDYASHISGLSLWYEQFSDSDPNLLVNDMTVTEIDAPIITDDLEYWNVTTPNDNHYIYALKDITFSSNGNIIGASMYVSNETTANVTEGASVTGSQFVLPQGSGLSYPKSRLNKQIKITGSFVNAYVTSDGNSQPDGYMIIDTNFTALTNAYDEFDTSVNTYGTISFFTQAQHVTSVAGLELGTPIDGWESKSFHIFSGYVL